MAAPIFYVVGAIIGAIWEGAHNKRSTTRLMLAAPLFLMSLEGSHQQISLAREQSVTAYAAVAATPRDVEAALETIPRNRHRKRSIDAFNSIFV